MLSTHRRIGIVGAFVLCIGFLGCGGGPAYDGPERASVSGKVTLDGAPVESGSITFIPEDSASRTISAPIGGGAYLLSEGHGPNLGAYKVSISVPKKTETSAADETNRPDENDPDAYRRRKEPEETLPAKYNSETELKVDVQSGDNTFDFVLQS